MSRAAILLCLLLTTWPSGPRMQLGWDPTSKKPTCSPSRQPRTFGEISSVLICEFGQLEEALIPVTERDARPARDGPLGIGVILPSILHHLRPLPRPSRFRSRTR